jgi:hypothetical protein
MIPQYVLIIGAMKSGTTTLFDLLANHPRVAPAYPKEPGFFAFEERWAMGFEWYESLFNFDPVRHSYALEGSTDYTKHPFCAGVVDRLEASAPRRFKLIYIARHPLRRIESHAKHVQLARCEVGMCPSPRVSHSLEHGVSPVSMAISRYHSQLRLYDTFHARGDLLVLAFEDLVRDQDATMRRVCAFLNLPFQSSASTHSLPAAVRFERPWYWDALQRVAPLSYAVKRLVPIERRRAILYMLGTRKFELKGRFKLTAEEERALRDTLRSECALFGERYGVDVGTLWPDIATGALVDAAAAEERA